MASPDGFANTLVDESDVEVVVGSDVDVTGTEVDDEEAAPTEVDSSSSSSDVEIVAARPPPVPQVRLAAARVRESCADVVQIGWQLQAEGEVDALGHVVQCVDGLMRRWRQFKIGITASPQRRWEMYETSRASQLCFRFNFFSAKDC